MAQSTSIHATESAPDQAGSEQARARWIAAGGILGALAASSCCILPLVLFSLGITGAWIANFTALAPYKPYFAAGCKASSSVSVTSLAAIVVQSLQATM